MFDYHLEDVVMQKDARIQNIDDVSKDEVLRKSKAKRIYLYRIRKP